jgi:aldose 1-epimerase
MTVIRTSALFAVAAACLVAACSRDASSTTAVQNPQPRVTQTPYARTAEGENVDLITLRNANGITLSAVNYGGIILTLKTPDRAGQMDDIVLGFDSLPQYEKESPYFGCIIGRYGNRIAKGQFTLDGKTYTLATNNDTNHLHGGKIGWDKKVWAAQTFNDTRGVGATFTLTSPDGDEGYPGAVRAEVTYTLTDKDQLIVDYKATTDKATVINLTQHSYFNLAGAKANDILGHELTINADKYTPVDPTLIPTGELANVVSTPFDFRKSTAIGARISQDNEQLKRGKGYDHNFVLNRTGAGLSQAAKVYEPQSGRTMEITTTEPGIQFYSGNFLDGKLNGKGGRNYPFRSGFCLETQHYPDSPNQKNFPSTVLQPGQEYKTQTVFTFGVQK